MHEQLHIVSFRSDFLIGLDFVPVSCPVPFELSCEYTVANIMLIPVVSLRLIFRKPGGMVLIWLHLGVERFCFETKY